jgi:hypothetical protein
VDMLYGRYSALFFYQKLLTAEVVIFAERCMADFSIKNLSFISIACIFLNRLFLDKT